MSLEWAYLGNSVDSICSSAFNSQTHLDSIYLGNQLKYIGYYAFGNCHSLKNVQFPSTLQELDYRCFESSGLLSVAIPAATTQISEAFSYCGDILSITVDAANPVYDSRDNCNAICRSQYNSLVRGCQNTVIPSTVTALDAYSFSGCSGLTSITIPNSVMTVSDYAFDVCGLTSVNFPNSITTCGSAPFHNCHGLTQPVYNAKFFVFLPYDYSGTYTFPTEPSQIVGEACSGRNLLTQVFIPDGYTSIGREAFRDCNLLDTVSIGEGITNLESGVFYSCSRLKGVHLPNTLKGISYRAFHDCHALLRITIPDAVEIIGTEAFANCTSLQYVAIPAAMQSFESWWGTPAFMGCTSLRHIYWNARTLQDLETPGHAPFYDIRAQITQFDLGDSVQYVPNYLCYEMTGLKTISIGAQVRKIGTPNALDTTNTVFYHCDSVNTIYWNARNVVNPLIYNFAPFYTIRQSVRTFTLGDSVRVIPSGLCYGMSNLTRLEIPEHVFYLGDYAFRHLENLSQIMVSPDNADFDSRNGSNAIIETATNLLVLGCANTVIPNDVVAIDPCAFRNCIHLSSLTIPQSVQSIGREAFNGCTGLTSITLPNGITTLEDYVFQDCESLQSLVLPSGLQRLGIRALSGCQSLPAMTLPASVNRIDQQAFAKTALNSLTMLGATPPMADITSLPDACPVYVPCVGFDQYLVAPVWSALGSRLATQYSYTIQAAPNNALWGSVNIQRTDCDAVSLEAEAATGFRFVEWQDVNGNMLSTENPYDLTLTANTVVIAFFQSANTNTNPTPTRILVRDRQVEVVSEEPSLWQLYNLSGQPVDRAEGDMVVLSAPTAGVFVLRSNNETYKVSIR